MKVGRWTIVVVTGGVVAPVKWHVTFLIVPAVVIGIVHVAIFIEVSVILIDLTVIVIST